MRFATGVDIGGTFTDLVSLDRQTGKLFTEKLLTTPGNPADAVISGLTKLSERHGVEISKTGRLMHATTLATNAVIERKGSVTGLLTTSGFEDVLDIRKGLRYDQYDLNIQMPAPYVPRFLRRGIDERVLSGGTVHRPMDETQVVESVKQLVNEGVESLAVCLIHSFDNPTHERRIGELIAQRFPALPVSLSHEVSPQIREYERMSTVVIDAYIKPTVRGYISELTARLRKLKFGGELLMMTCSGGVIGREVAERIPVLLLESGPVAGASMAAEISKALKFRGTFSFDMGGTTAKGCIIRGRTIEKAYEFEAARAHKFRRGSGIPIGIPVARLIEIGSGGGSLANVDELGMVRVGPESAGADPGPACYDRGGRRPTVTDSDLLLGYLDPDFFLGGGMKLSPDKARAAVEAEICRETRLDVTEGAWAIHERINEDVATAFRLHASEIGIDYRSFYLISFGGAGPVHAARISSKLGAKGVVIPPKAGVFSAAGLLVTPLSIDIAQSRRVELSELSYAEYREVFDDLIQRASSRITSIGGRKGSLSVSRHLDMRYHGQGYDIEVDLGKRISPDELSNLSGSFERSYRSKYSISGISKSIDVTSFKVTVSAPNEKFLSSSLGHMTEEIRPARTRPAFDHRTRRFRKYRVVSRYSLQKGDEVQGPALIQEVESTCVVPSGFTARVDGSLNLSLEGGKK